MSRKAVFLVPMLEGFKDIAPRYDRLNDVISLGLHRKWKATLVAQILLCANSKDGVWLDVSTGTGDLLLEVKKQARHIRRVGLDPCEEMLNQAREKDSTANEFHCAFSEQIPMEDASVDFISCSFGVRNFRHRQKAFSEWSRILRPGGVAGVLEIHPASPSWYRPLLNLYWTNVMPGFGALLSQRRGYTYLRDSSTGFIPPKDLSAELTSAGLPVLLSRSLFGRGMVTLFLTRKE